MSRFREKFIESGLEKVKDDPYAELFADCQSVEEILQLEREIAEAEASE